jgi:hypothetical protein
VPVFNLAAPPPQPRVTLQTVGPVIEVELVNPQFVVQTPALGAAGPLVSSTPAPTILRGRALVDTGASGTSIDSNAANQLGLTARGVVQFQSASHPYQARQFAVGYRFVGVPNFNLIPVTEAPNLAAQNLIMLIGRDLLAVAVLVYNGITGAFSLSW